MGIYSERKFSYATGFLILLAAFLALYLPAFFNTREFFRQEGIYAAAAQEVEHSGFAAPAGRSALRVAHPLFPALASLVYRATGLPMEMVLRGISVLLLGATTIVVYLAAASERSCRAGWVAAAMYFSCAVAMEKGSDGYPLTLEAFFLLAAQLLFFNFGVRRVNWNFAWISFAVLGTAAFFTGGLGMLVFLIAPLFFLRRPLSVSSKFRKPGFIVALAVVVTALLYWWAPFYGSGRQQLESAGLEWLDISLSSYLEEIIAFPLYLVIRLLPWSLIAWLPFCVALQSLDATPIFSRYLRTLCFVTIALLLLIPKADSGWMLFAVGPLSILVGINYELGMRRYGARFRRVLRLGEFFALGVAVLVAGACFLPLEWLKLFFSLSKTLAFREAAGYGIVAFGAIGAALLIALLLRHGRETEPVWLQLLLVSLAGGVFFCCVLQPYQAQEKYKRILGNDIRMALAANRANRIYKIDINDLHGGLFYSGAEVVKVGSLDELPESEPVIYLIATEFPQRPDRSWSNLFPPGYTYRGQKLALWKGVLRPLD